MKVAILADVHSNLEALEAVLGDVGEVDPANPDVKSGRGASEIWCLGDTVGYGPNPNECCALIEKKAKYCVLGNHDAGVLGKLELGWFNAFAAEAIEITRKGFEKEYRRFLENLPEVERLDEIVLVHGSVKNPLTEYIFETHQAEENFEESSEKICFCGHSHYPVVFEKDDDVVREIVPYFQKKIKLKKSCRYLINSGSVGQPRDGDNRASYGVFDDQKLTFEFRRVPYPIGKTQEKMRKLGLPEFLVQRLAIGR